LFAGNQAFFIFATQIQLMKKNQPHTWAHLALTGAYIIYGINFSVAKGIMPQYLKPFALIALRPVVTAVLFWLTSFFIPKEKVSSKDLLFFFGCSFLGVVLNQAFFIAGLNLTTPINSSIILTINPIAVFVLAAIILKEDISFFRGSGLAIGFAGVMLLILHEGRTDMRNSTFLGDLLSLLSTVIWALYTVLIKRMLEKYHPVTVMKWTFFFGMLVSAPFGYSQLRAADWSSMPVNIWLSLIFVTVGSTFIGYLLVSHGLRKLSPTVVSSYAYTQPLFAAFVATIFGQDRIDIFKIASAILIFAGVFIISRPQTFGKSGSFRN
jgi:drug/metabolite transporter (DMT)-like permease